MEYERFSESGVDFVFQRDYLFRIEKSRTLLALNKNAKENEGIKTVEFLFLDNNFVIWIVEAKTGTPQPKNENDYNIFINDIKDKLHDSLYLFLAIYFNRHTEKLSDHFREIDLSKVKFKLVLLITSSTYKEDWLDSLKSDLSKLFMPIITKIAKIWSFPPCEIMVLNPSMAEDLGLLKNLK